MFCKYCGNELPNDAKFCARCGKVSAFIADNEEVQNADDAQTVQSEETATASETVKEEKCGAKGALVFSILALAFGITFFLSPIGLVFLIISKKKLNRYKAKYGITKGKALAAKIINIIGFSPENILFGDIRERIIKNAVAAMTII